MIKNDSNNILTIIFKDGSSTSLAFPSARDKDDAIKLAMQIEHFSESDVSEYYFSTSSSDKNLESFNYFDPENKNFKLKEQATDIKVDEFRKRRDMLLPKLDIEFLKTLEDDNCPLCKDHIVQIKRFFREVPSLMKEEFESYDDPKDIMIFNPFNNIFEIIVAKPGKGYSTPPTLQIGPPNGRSKGFQLEAAITVKDDSVFEIEVTKIGSGYIGIPKVIIGPPDDPEGEQAFAIAFMPENDIYKE